MFIEDYLSEKSVSDDLQAVVLSCVKSFIDIYKSVGFSSGYAVHENVYGEKQAKLDLVSNDIFVDEFSKNESVALIASEELESVIRKKVEGESYCVVFDPLDGSSVSDSNLSVGSIIGIYAGDTVIGKTGRDQVAVLMSVYGPKLMFYLSFGEDVLEFYFDEKNGQFLLMNEQVTINDDGEIFAPGDVNSALDEDWYHETLHYWLKNGYKLRYSGSMAADVNNILKKKGGIYLYPGTSNNPSGKLRLLYECAPAAMLVENAGGTASNGKKSILDIQIDSVDQTEPFFVGSKNEVKRVEGFLQ